jgi:hypothetical protein
MKDIINRVKDCIQKTTNIYNQEKFNTFIDNYNNVLTLQGDKKENLQKMFNMLLQFDDKEKINFEDELGNNVNIKMYDEIGQGTYSMINKGIMQKDEYDEEIVLRIPKVMPLIEIVDGKEIEKPESDALEEFKNKTVLSALEESLLGIVLYCYIQTFPDIFILGNPFIKIKAIFVLNIIDEKAYNIPLLITGMEKMRYPYGNILVNRTNVELFGILAWISFNLKKLQQIMLFTHRDFHTGNVMINKIQSTTINVGYLINDQTFRPYIIDLGETCVNLGCDDGCKNIQFPQYYDVKDTCNNNSQDLRTLLASIYINYFRPEYNPNCRRYLSDNNKLFRQYLELKFKNYIKAGFTHQHTYYDEVLNLVDAAFLPDTILNEISLFFDENGEYKHDLNIRAIIYNILPGNPGELTSNRFDKNGEPKQ